MASSLDMLVDDILIQILQALSVHAVLSLRKTSRRYYLLSKLRCVWYSRFCADVLARNLPLPGPPRPLSLLSAAELERRTLRALYLESTWPRLSANTLVSRHCHGLDQVVFIPGGTEFLTVQGDTVVYWLIVSWPGFAQGLKHVAEWTPVEGVPCRIVKDGDASGVLAVGPRTPLESHYLFAKVFMTSLEAPFVTMCDYARVPGVVVGVWRHLLVLDTTREVGGGLELLDWRAQTTGTALLPCLADAFGDFVDFAAFAGHLLVVWQRCVSVFPVPGVPADGRVVVEHVRVFLFQEAVCRPVGFTTCVARGVRAVADVDWDRWDRDRHRPRPRRWDMGIGGISPTLTIVARSQRRAGAVSMVMLVPLVDVEDEDEDVEERGVVAKVTAFPYRVAYLPVHVPATYYGCGNGGQSEVGERGMVCTSLCVGSSGRGVYVVGGRLCLMSPGLHVLPPYEMQIGPVLEEEKVYCMLCGMWDRDRPQVQGWGWEEEGECGDRMDFDEGMGRFVVATARGIEVVQLD